MISRKIKVEVGVVSWSWRVKLVTFIETLNILDITKTESNDCLIIHWTKNNMEVLSFLLHLHVQQSTQSAQTWHDYMYIYLDMITQSYTTVIHDMITRDFECPWHDYWMYNLQLDDVAGTYFEKSLYAFGQSEWVQCMIILLIRAGVIWWSSWLKVSVDTVRQYTWWLKGIFWVVFCLCVKMSLSAKPFIWLFSYERFWMKTRFETSSTQTWPIATCV